jgi:hypothetical protein
MEIYNLGKVASITDARGEPRYDFNITGVRGRPLVSFAFDTREEADAAHAAMQAIVETAKLITIAAYENDSRPRPKTDLR